MRFDRKVALVGALLVAFGCGGSGSKLGEAGGPDDKVLATGDAAKNGASSAIGQAVQNATNPQGASDGGGFSAAAAPSANLAPPSSLYGAGSAKAGLAPSQDQEAQLGPWLGPETGPDGEAGWYRRIYTWSWPGTDGTEIEQVNSYWLRAEPAHDFKTNGFDNMAVDTIHYAWTMDEGFWADFEYRMVLRFVHPYRTIDGSIVPGAMAGEWQWSVAEGEDRYAGSKSNGTFRYRNGLYEVLYHPSEEIIQTLRDMGTGSDLEFSGEGEYMHTYLGEFIDNENDKTYKYFGGGEGASSFAVAVTKTSSELFDVFFAQTFMATYFWGRGEQDAGVDYLLEPEYDAEVTPPGSLWGDYYTGQLQANAEEPADGLLYWGESEGYSSNSQGVRLTAENKIVENEDSEGQSVYFNRSRWLSAAGGPEQEYFSCSDASIDPNCPQEATGN